MQLILSRTIPIIDTQSLETDQAREVLFRNGSGFVLYLSGGDLSPVAEERVISLDLREALIWLNEASQHRGSLWS
jgi:hypothetical protein